MVLYRLSYDVCLPITLCFALSIHLLEYIIHSSIGVQISLYNLLDWNMKLFSPGIQSQVLLQNQLTSSKSKFHGHRKLEVIASKCFEIV